MSQVAHRLLVIHLQVDLPAVGVSGEPGPIMPAFILPFDVALITNGLSAFVSGPAVGGAGGACGGAAASGALAGSAGFAVAAAGFFSSALAGAPAAGFFS